MVNLERSYNYRWTPLDALNAQKSEPRPTPQALDAKWADYQNRKVSPYGFVREMLPGCEANKPGQDVTIDMSKSKRYRFEVLRFANVLPDPDVDWLAAPHDVSEVADATTIGELCAGLYARSRADLGAKFGGIYDAFKDYDPAQKVDESLRLRRRELARAIFDFWGNTKYRYALVTTYSRFNWTDAFERPWELPTQATVQEEDGAGGTKPVIYQIASIPIKTPTVRAAPVRPNTGAEQPKPQAIKVPDADAARKVLEYIKVEAQRRAQIPKSIDPGSKFYRRLTTFYLADYLARPSPVAGVEAARKSIGDIFIGTPRDGWEQPAIRTWNRQPVPAPLRKLRPTLPEYVEGATAILSQENRAYLPYIDIDHLIGEPNEDSSEDGDIAGGKNPSQLMHWATGVKYYHVGAQPLRELFIGYELWHLEAWDVFGEDPINDLIAEDGGRALGERLAAGTINSGNLKAELDRAFNDARAWVGSMLRMRQHELDQWILLDEARRSHFHWRFDYENENHKRIWGAFTIKTLLKKYGLTVEQIKKERFVERIIGVYTLVYEADEWEKKNGRVPNTTIMESLVRGEFDDFFRKVNTNRESEITASDKARAAKKAGL